MRVWITGAGGMLGRALVAAFQDVEVLPTYHASGFPRVDLTDIEAVRAFAAAHRPDLVVNAAAVTDVDRCEADPEAAMAANALSVRHMAGACRSVGAELIQISTDFVFSGKLGRPYREGDRTRPINAYGRSKLLGEQFARRLLAHRIVRTQWLFDREVGFPHRIVSAARSGQPLRVVTDQIGCPTFVPDLAKAIRALADRPVYGTFHVVNSGACSKWDLAVEALRLAGLGDVAVERCITAEFPTPAARPRANALEADRFVNEGFAPLRPWRAAMIEAMAARREGGMED